jgi:hypothetical protein
MSKLLDAAIAITNYCELADVERGGPANETYVQPQTGSTEDNSTFIPVKLLNALREAAKESPYYKDPAKERRDREMIEAYMWAKSPGQGSL